MVMTSKTSVRRTFLVDFAGATVVIACLSSAAWFTLLREDQTAQRIADLEKAIHERQSELTELRSKRDEERILLNDRQRRLKERGSLPTEAPVEQYLQTLSGLARRFQLDIIRQNPLPERTYPGLLERRYGYEVSGSTNDIAGFFKALEQMDFWADIGYLKIVGNSRNTHGQGTRVASLTISIFSAPSTKRNTEQG